MTFALPPASGCSQRPSRPDSAADCCLSATGWLSVCIASLCWRGASQAGCLRPQPDTRRARSGCSFARGGCAFRILPAASPCDMRTIVGLPWRREMALRTERGAPQTRTCVPQSIFPHSQPRQTLGGIPALAG